MARPPSAERSRGVLLVQTAGRVKPRDWKRYEQVGLRPELDLDELVFNWTAKRTQGPRGERRGHRRRDRDDDRGARRRSPSTCATPTASCSGATAGARSGASRRRRSCRCRSTRAGTRSCRPTCSASRCRSRSTASPTSSSRSAYNTASGEAQLTFEHEFVYLLRRHKGAKRAPRKKVTRAQFILSLAKELEPEIRKRRYRFVCPELNIRQPIDRGQRKTTKAPVSGTSSGGGGGRSLDRVYPLHKAGEEGYAVHARARCAPAPPPAASGGRS